jgi:adenine-specific DNA methylase
LIEDWLPIEAIGTESKRKRGASSALPPLYFLHVWWARRPLTTSRAATIANDLNPVAAVILKATLDYPARFAPSLATEIGKWGNRWYEVVKAKLEPYFTPLPHDASGACYLWARTVVCPTTGKLVPLSPNWWLSKKKNPIAIRLVAEEQMDVPHFVI